MSPYLSTPCHRRRVLCARRRCMAGLTLLIVGGVTAGLHCHLLSPAQLVETGLGAGVSVLLGLGTVRL